MIHGMNKSNDVSAERSTSSRISEKGAVAMKKLALVLGLCISALAASPVPVAESYTTQSYWTGVYALSQTSSSPDFPAGSYIVTLTGDKQGIITLPNGRSVAVNTEGTYRLYVPAWGNAEGSCQEDKYYQEIADKRCASIIWNHGKNTTYFMSIDRGSQPPVAGGTVTLPPPPTTPAPPSAPAKSAASFSGMNGQVEVSSDGGKTWKSARLDMVLNYEDMLRTDEDATAILSFADMSTFSMKPESTIVIVKPQDNTGQISKLKFIAGNIWVNVQKMIKDGSMEIDLNQAVAGIKGTKFQLWETGARNSSIIQVEEGVVSFRNKTTGQTVDVSAGQTVSATPTGFINSWTLGNTTEVNEQVLFDNFNPKQVFNGGQSSWFYLSSPTIINYIMTYHWNDGKGAPAGSISLRREDGSTWGPWAVTLANNGRYWEARMRIVLRPGRYQVVDSDPSTWSQNTGAGFTQIKGFRQ